MDYQMCHNQAMDQEGQKQPQPMDSQVTLLIRHLPEAITHDTLTQILSHYGASSVRLCFGGRLRNCAFVDFRNDILAYQAHSKLNGLRFLGKVLSVERAGKSTGNNEGQSEPQMLKDSKPATATVMDNLGLKVLNEGSQSGCLTPREPVAPRLGVDYPFPPYLEYAYPPPDDNILANIVNTLLAVPRFYTQVLHLMNKMNLPAPFRMALPTPPLPPSAPEPKQPVPPSQPPPPPASVSFKAKHTDLSSEESEMESSDEEVIGDADSSAAAILLRKPARKRVKREAIVGPAIDKDVAHEAVGLKPSTLVPKEIPMIKKRNPVLQIKIAPKTVQNEQKEYSVPKETEEPDTQVADPRTILTPKELERGKLPLEEILSLPMFKNYAAGNPTTKLYIKNLAKDVTADDFYFIFGSIFGNIDAARSGLNVNLMQEGRMRGQAFVTFPSAELAHHALNLVNGYVLKGKPMIIQFGRK